MVLPLLPVSFTTANTMMSMLLMQGITMTMWRAFLNQTIPQFDFQTRNPITGLRLGLSNKFLDDSPPSSSVPEQTLPKRKSRLKKVQPTVQFLPPIVHQVQGAQQQQQPPFTIQTLPNYAVTQPPFTIQTLPEYAAKSPTGSQLMFIGPQSLANQFQNTLQVPLPQPLEYQTTSSSSPRPTIVSPPAEARATTSIPTTTIQSNSRGNGKRNRKRIRVSFATPRIKTIERQIIPPVVAYFPPVTAPTTIDSNIEVETFNVTRSAIYETSTRNSVYFENRLDDVHNEIIDSEPIQDSIVDENTKNSISDEPTTEMSYPDFL